jgi:PKD repeat protein
MSKLLPIAASALVALQLLLTGMTPALVSANSGSLTATINFQVGSNQPHQGLIADFGDGSSQVISSAACLLDDAAPCSIDQPITHTYKAPGTYTVNLYNSDCDEALVATQTVTVK